MRLVTLKRRPEFLRLRGGHRVGRPAFVLEGRPRETAAGIQADGDRTRFGFTVTKALGNAVVRNRIRRRLKAAVQQSIAGGPPLPVAFDVVLIARAEAGTMAFATLVEEVDAALKRLATAPAGKGRAGQGEGVRRGARSARTPAVSPSPRGGGR